MARSGLFYVRFMDDIQVLAPTRWKIRKAVKVVNGMLGSPSRDCMSGSDQQLAVLLARSTLSLYSADQAILVVVVDAK
jgi:hypothetical protein